MTERQYQAQELTILLKDLQSKKVSETLYLDVKITSEEKKRSRVLVWEDGSIVYGGIKVPDAPRLVKMLKYKLNREQVATAISFSRQEETTQTSNRTLLEWLVKMQLLTWKQIETVAHTQIVLTLEQVLPYAGQFQFDSTAQFKIYRGLELSKLMLDVAHRQDKWSRLKSVIPSPEAVPELQANALETITDLAVRKHLQKWVDGQRSLVDIAEGLNKDPLKVAKTYLHWVQAGWLVIKGTTPTANISLPRILAVDDSTMMQELIKLALDGYYEVMVASNAVDALNLIYQEKISLVLLDVSMPEIDGLELCRTVRSISQFRDLPIIIVTAQDGFFDKLKGRFAGCTEYLTKPFDAEKLRQLVGKYVNVGIASVTESTITK